MRGANWRIPLFFSMFSNLIWWREFLPAMTVCNIITPRVVAIVVTN